MPHVKAKQEGAPKEQRRSTAPISGSHHQIPGIVSEVKGMSTHPPLLPSIVIFSQRPGIARDQRRRNFVPRLYVGPLFHNYLIDFAHALIADIETTASVHQAEVTVSANVRARSGAVRPRGPSGWRPIPAKARRPISPVQSKRRDRAARPGARRIRRHWPDVQACGFNLEPQGRQLPASLWQAVAPKSAASPSRGPARRSLSASCQRDGFVSPRQTPALCNCRMFALQVSGRTIG